MEVPSLDAATILVCGGRTFGVQVDGKSLLLVQAEERYVFDRLDYLHRQRGIGLIVHGAARGADLLAEAWAKANEIPYFGIPAEWKKYGKAAGMKRNRAMLQFAKPTCVVAFPGGRGTANMCALARAANVPVWIPADAPV
jgi:hypothetical protein